jgi:hypothetical protein
MAHQPVRHRLACDSTRIAYYLTYHEATGRWTFDMYEWDRNTQAMCAVTPSALYVDFVFAGPDRHYRLRVPGKQRPRVAMCGASLQGFRTSAAHSDQMAEGDRLNTACAECRRRFNGMLR